MLRAGETGFGMGDGGWDCSMYVHVGTVDVDWGVALEGEGLCFCRDNFALSSCIGTPRIRIDIYAT